MKRLKTILMSMDNNTATYKEMYEGTVIIPAGTYGNPSPQAVTDSDPVYWFDDISVEITTTHKNAKDKPTLVFMIPAEIMGITEYTSAAADYCLRCLVPYIEKLNAEIYNRSRPDAENGKYYLFRPKGEVL